jgi:hypothetical protein
VSTWLLYTDGVREHLDAARRRQAQTSSGPPRAVAPADQAPLTPASLRTDLALARAEFSRLRAEHDKLRHRLRLQLGAEIDGPDRAELITRVADLESLTANYSPNATPAPPKPTSHNDASGNSKTT